MSTKTRRGRKIAVLVYQIVCLRAKLERYKRANGYAVRLLESGRIENRATLVELTDRAVTETAAEIIGLETKIRRLEQQT